MLAAEQLMTKPAAQGQTAAVGLAKPWELMSLNRRPCLPQSC